MRCPQKVNEHLPHGVRFQSAGRDVVFGQSRSVSLLFILSP